MGLGDLGSISGRIIPKTLKVVLDTSLLNTQQYKVRIKVKVEQSRERNSALPYLSVVAIEKEAFWSPSTTVTNFTYIYLSTYLYIIFILFLFLSMYFKHSITHPSNCINVNLLFSIFLSRLYLSIYLSINIYINDEANTNKIKQGDKLKKLDLFDSIEF